MLKKVLIGLGIVALIAASSLTTFFILNRAHQAEIATLSSSIATLQANIDAIGPIIDCYTVKTVIDPGTELTADMLVTQSIPKSFVNDDFVLDLINITTDVTEDEETGDVSLGYFAKTYINPGTPITKSLLMSEDLPDSAREIDITGNRWPIGMKEGDYVDIRITYAFGEDFIVLPHKRIYEINNQTLKVHMTEEEMHIYQAALVDWYLTSDKGTDLYFTKYIEPGYQDSATAYYTIPDNIETVCLADPNIVNRALVTFKENLYNLQVNARDAAITDQEAENRKTQQGSLIAAGRAELNSRVSTDFQDWYQEYLAMKAEQEAQLGNSGGGDSLIEGSVD